MSCNKLLEIMVSHMRIIIAAMLFIAVPAYATVQMPEIFEVDAASFSIYQEPLESHPQRDKVVGKLTKSHCTANYRGYQGWWELSEGFLWLTGISESPCDDLPKDIEIEELFSIEEHRIKASWYSGDIIVRIGERTFFEGSRRIEYQAVVYSFTKGKLSKREIRTVVGRSNF